MKKLICIALFSILALPAFAQTRYIQTFGASAFAKATSRSDTSATLTVGAYPRISVQTTTTGTDSAKIAVHIDALVNGVWWNDLVDSAAVTLGRPAGYALAGSAHTGQVANFTLRDLTSAATGAVGDALKNCSQFRVRNNITPGAGDSTSATTYTQKVALAKVTW